MGLIIAAGLSYIAIISHAQKLDRKLRFEMESDAVAQAIFEVYSDPKVCTSAVRSVMSSTPDFKVPILLTNVGSLLKRGESVGGILRVERVALRTFDATKDSTPGHKIDIDFISLDSQLGESEITRTHDLFVANRSLTQDQKFQFQCSTLPLTQISSKLVVVSSEERSCEANKEVTVKCPEGLKAISCSMRFDLLRTFDDQFRCLASLEKGECTFVHSQVGSTCELMDGVCNCL